jgi:hypothetical protein
MENNLKAILIATLTEKLLSQEKVVAKLQFDDYLLTYTFTDNSGIVNLYEVEDGTGFFDTDTEVYDMELKYLIEAIQQNKLIRVPMASENLA